jgi:hypothetical protein
MVPRAEHEQGGFEGRPRVHLRQNQNNLDACCQIDNLQRGAPPKIGYGTRRGRAACRKAADLLIPNALHASPKPPPTGTASAARIIDHEPGRPAPAWGRPYAVRGNLMGAGSTPDARDAASWFALHLGEGE